MKNKFKKLSLLLVVTLLFSFVVPTAFAQNTLTNEKFLSELNLVSDEASFLNLISENVLLVENLDTYKYYDVYDYVKQKTASLFVLNKKAEYTVFEDFQRDFEVYVLLARVNTASNWNIIHEIINNYNDYLGIDLPVYNSLTNKEEVAIQLFHGYIPFNSVSDFKVKFDNAVIYCKHVEGSQSSSMPSSPSVGGRAFDCSIIQSDGTAFESQPENGTKVKLVIETSVMQLNTVFVVAVYDNDNTLKNVKTFDITATDEASLETLELITEYDSSGIIKLFNLYDMIELKPVALSLSSNFSECRLGE